MNKSIIGKTIKLICFLLIFLILLQHFSFVLVDKSAAAENGYIYDEKNDIDVLFLGTSVTNSGISPLDLWNNYGITSYNIAQDGQGIANSYYSLKSVLQYQNPKVVVMDLAYIDRDSSSGMIHNMIDNIPFSLEKVEAVLNLASVGELDDYLIPITYYHSRWDSIYASDYEIPICRNRGGEIRYYSKDENGDVFDTSVFEEPLTIIPESQTASIDETRLQYIYDIIDLCNKNNVEIVFVNYPCYAWGKTNHGDGETLQKKWNMIGQLLEKENVTFLNGIQLADEIGFDYVVDLRDWRHLSGYGNEKITNWIGQWLVEKYNLEDHRNEEQFQCWDEDYKEWEEYKAKQENK